MNVMGMQVITSVFAEEEIGQYASYERPMWRRVLAGKTTDVRPMMGPGSYKMGDTLVIHPAKWAELKGHVLTGTA